MATRRRRNKKVSAKETVQQQEPVVIETPVEIVEQPVAQQEAVVTEPVKEEVVTPVAEETTQDSSKKEKEYVIAKPMLFTGDIKDLIPDGMNNGLNNPALEIPQQWQQQNIQQPQPVQQTIAQVEVQNPQAMGSEQKAALEQSIALQKKEEQNMVKQEQLDKVNEAKIEQQEVNEMNEMNKLEALIGAKIAEAGNAQQEEKSLKDAFVEGAVIGIGAGVGTVAGIYVADKAIGAFEEWRNTKDAAEETSKLIAGLL